MIGVQKKRASLSKSEIEGLWVAVSQREFVLAVVSAACANAFWLMPRFAVLSNRSEWARAWRNPGFESAFDKPRARARSCV